MRAANYEILSSRSFTSTNNKLNKQHTYTVKEEANEIDETEDEVVVDGNKTTEDSYLSSIKSEKIEDVIIASRVVINNT